MSRGAEALQTRMWELITGVWKEQLEQDLSNLPIQWNKFTACGDGRTKHTHTHTHCVCRGTEDLCICIGFANLCALQDYLVTCAITSSIIYLLTYLLSGAEFFFRSYRFSVSQEIPRIYGTRRFINACTSVRHLFLSWASYIPSLPPHPTAWRSTLILSSQLWLGLPSGSSPRVSPPKNCMSLFYMYRPSHSSRFDHPNNICCGVQIIKLLSM